MVPHNGPLFKIIRFCHFQTDITSPLQNVLEKKIVSTQSYRRKKVRDINFL